MGVCALVVLMIKTWQTTLNDLGIAVLDAFLFPGTFALSHLSTHAPAIALQLGITAEGNGVILPAAVSVLSWSLLLFLIWKISRLLVMAAQIANAVIRRSFSQAAYRIRSLRARIAYKARQVIPMRRSDNSRSVSEIEFNDLDVTVLQTSAALPPGLVLSAPDLAGKLTLRPAQVQRSLDKLRKHQLLDSVIGATDGFDNYRLTQAGATLLATLDRSK